MVYSCISFSKQILLFYDVSFKKQNVIRGGGSTLTMIQGGPGTEEEVDYRGFLKVELRWTQILRAEKRDAL